ncbi:hypothetical protein FRB98_008984 [Tulasnella sp. 332]|nr:hypothetical protein FRB98_008984 [Tulasnella sp. 332]
MDRGTSGVLYEFPIEPRADIIALLGDVGTVADPDFFSFLRGVLNDFKTVLFVAGNHEFYRFTHRLMDFEQEIRAGRSTTGGGEFIFLHRKRFDVSPKLAILGCTLWSDLNPDDRDILSWSVTDFKRIKDFTFESFVELHRTDLEWLESEVAYIRSTRPEMEVAIFTHHAPTMDGTADPKYAGGPTTSAFATELTKNGIWAKPVKVWAFGHTHWSCQFERLGVKVISNQRGYGGAGAKGAIHFDSNFILEL